MLVTTANSAVTTANTADTNASAAVVTANAASVAVSNAVSFTLIANVSAIPGSPSNNDYVEIGNSIGIESFSPLSGLPSGFVGESGLTVRLGYDTSSTSWVFLNYFANDSETRYAQINAPTFTGNVGIGTSSPQAKLDVRGASAEFHLTNTTGISATAGAAQVVKLEALGQKNGVYGPAGAITFRQDDATWSSVNQYIKPTRIEFSTQNTAATDLSETARMVIDRDGNVGIGTTNPQAKLHLYGEDPVFIVQDSGTGVATANATIRLAESDGSATIDNYWDISAAKSGSSNFGFGIYRNLESAPDLFISKANGNVGIGTDSPEGCLDIGKPSVAGVPSLYISRSNSVNDTSDIAMTANAVIRSDSLRNVVNAGGIFTWNIGGTDVKAGISGSSENMRITANGNVGIGTDSPSEKLSVSGNGTFTGTVSAQGSVLTSDQRFKENITDAHSQLADVTALGNSLHNWDWTDDAPVADKDVRFLGLVAQEAETICPGIVTTIVRTKDGAELTPEVVVPAVYETTTVPAVLDEEGEVVEAETTEEVLVTEEQVTPATYEQLDDSYKGIKNDILIMKLLGAVAELSAKVAALEAAN